jgi:hypothetical protein
MIITKREINLFGKVSKGMEGYEKFCVDETFVFCTKKTLWQRRCRKKCNSALCFRQKFDLNEMNTQTIQRMSKNRSEKYLSHCAK